MKIYKQNKLYIAVDFDGTCVTHRFPEVGEDIGAEPVLKSLVEKGHKLILNTMRPKKLQEDAINWFKERDIPLYGVNYNPTQKMWTDSTKVYANIYIDDAALGTPVKIDETGRPYVDWELVEKILKNNEVL